MGAVIETAAEPVSRFETVHSALLLGFGELVEELGGDAAALLASAGQSADSLSTIGYRQLAHLLEHAAEQLNCPDFGMRLATLQGGRRALGPITKVMQNSRTLGDALEFVARHSQAHCQAACIYMERDGEGGVVVGHDILLGRMPFKSQMVEQFMLLGHLIAVEHTSGFVRARQVRFRHQRVSAPSVYRRYFNCDVCFDQHDDALVYAQADLQRPLENADQRLCDGAAAFIEATFPSMAMPVHARVRAIVLRLIGVEDCNNIRVASELAMHPRTLHRKLGAEGVSFQSIKDDVRRDLALYYLRYTDLDIMRIAERLGFAEHSVVTRACVRWFGAPPRELRLAWRVDSVLS